MATFNFRTHLLYILIISPLVKPLDFSYDSNSGENSINIEISGPGNDAYIDKNGIIHLTKNTTQHGTPSRSCGWVSYKNPISLKDPNTGQQAIFITHFSFIIDVSVDESNSGCGDGLAFLMSPYPHNLPTSSCELNLGLFSNADNMNSTKNQLVAVEFDTFMNPEWDYDNHHIGINVNTIKSVINKTLDDEVLMKNGTVAYAWITYNSQTLSVYLTYEDNSNPTRPSQPKLSYRINLTDILPNDVAIGFSAAATAAGAHQILTWDFISTFDTEVEIRHLLQNTDSDSSPSPSPSFDSLPSDISQNSYSAPKKENSSLYLPVVASCIIGLAAFSVGFVCFFIWRKKSPGEKAEEICENDQSSEDFDRKFSKCYTYKSLVIATTNFSVENKLGEGGFGPVFKGFFRDRQYEVAVKRVCNTKRSTVGLEEYKSEVKVLSRLSHRNLIKLKGWCEEKGELLLIYKFMPNGSLDSQLYSKNRLLTWPERYKISLGLSSALNYLHEECERCILHRDIKPGNVLLDSQFEAKLSDFGLSRLVDHNHTSKNTLLAGTQGYIAPEYFYEGRASKESDIYSLGVVLLEMACGRPPLGHKDGETNLIEFVWDLYGRQDILQAADKRLNNEYDAQEMLYMLIVGLWCVHPSYTERPKISQAINVLKLNSPLPNLPSSRDQCFIFQNSSASSSTWGYSISSGNITRSSHVSSSTLGSSPLALLEQVF